MPLVSIPSNQAYQSLKTNPTAFWPGRSDGANRLEPICTPAVRPSFKLAPGEKVFTIGSCFARNIEKQLRRLGYKTPTGDYVPHELTGQPLDGFMNKFTPQSMLNEIRWALAPEEMPALQEALLLQADGRVIDGQLMSKMDVSPQRGVERRREVTQVFQGIRECRITVITLGLVEAWFDKTSGLYLNRSVPREIAEASPDRFELHVLSYDELYTATRRLIELILTRGHPDAHLLLTVSPVPLMATFTDQDVLTANMYSKSSLRTVVEHVVREFDAVDYFPSFESIMLSDRSITWQEDLGHVTEHLVGVNVGRMAEAYAHSDAAAENARKLMPNLGAKREEVHAIGGSAPDRPAEQPVAAAPVEVGKAPGAITRPESVPKLFVRRPARELNLVEAHVAGVSVRRRTKGSRR